MNNAPRKVKNVSYEVQIICVFIVFFLVLAQAIWAEYGCHPVRDFELSLPLSRRAGERSRALLRGEENPAEEASMLFLVAQVGWFADVFFIFYIFTAGIWIFFWGGDLARPQKIKSLNISCYLQHNASLVGVFFVWKWSKF